MENEWRVAYAVVDGVKQFVIWRLKKPHRGNGHQNREYAGGQIKTRKEAYYVADLLNRHGRSDEQ